MEFKYTQMGFIGGLVMGFVWSLSSSGWFMKIVFLCFFTGGGLLLGFIEDYSRHLKKLKNK